MPLVYSLLLPFGAAVALLPSASAILRVTTGMSLPHALLLAGGGAALVVPRAVRKLRRLDGGLLLPSASAAALLIACSYFYVRMYHPLYEGLVSVGGGDAGNHVEWGRIFVEDDPGVYHGFAAFYALVYWMNRFVGDDLFAAYRAAYYSTSFFILAAAVLLAAGSLFDTAYRRGKGALLFFALLAALSYFPIERIFFPLLHYLQADGFYSQLASIFSLFVTAAAYSLARQTALRIGLLFLGAALCRYTYGLNFADLLFAMALLLWWERRLASSTLARTALAAAAFVLVGASLYGYLLLFPVLRLEGAIVTVDRAKILLSCAALILGCLAASRSLGHDRDGSALERLLLFSAAFGFASTVAQPALELAANPEEYYLQKYGYQAVMLLCWSVLVAGALIVTELVTELSALASSERTNAIRRRFAHCGRRYFVAGVSAALGLLLLNIALRPLRASYLERARETPAPLYLEPLADRQAWRLLAQVLEESGNSFGGFVTPSWPQSNFINAAFGHYGELLLFRRGSVSDKPGNCVFWMSSAEDVKGYRKAGGPTLLRRVDALRDAAPYKTRSYADPRTGRLRELSYRCRQDGS